MPKTEYVRLDGWRGYYRTVLTPFEKKQGWREFTDLSYVSGQDNDRYKDMTKDILRSFGYAVHSTYGRGSNLFSMNLSMFVKPKDGAWTPEKKKLIKALAEEYVNTYSDSFSVMSGTTREIDFDGYKRKMTELAGSYLAGKRKKLSKVI